MDERNILVYRNIYRKDDLLQFQEMCKLIKNWKGAKLYLKGEHIDFDIIGSGIQCYIHTVLKHENTTNSSEGCKAFDPSPFFLLGCVGCRRSHVSMAWNVSQTSEISVWFAFGKLDRHRVYHIHRKELESAVIGELIEYRHCPMLDLEKIREFIQRLPGRIDPRKDREWKYTQRGKKRSASSVAELHFSGIAAKEPEILPVSEEAYCEYLKRKL